VRSESSVFRRPPAVACSVDSVDLVLGA
jgi:hypothetical protein